MIKWIRTIRLSIKNSLYGGRVGSIGRNPFVCTSKLFKNPSDTHSEPSALYCWILEILTAIRKDAGLHCGPCLRKGEVFAYDGLSQNLKDLLGAISLYALPSYSRNPFEIFFVV
jgi:hypothetical protein